MAQFGRFRVESQLFEKYFLCRFNCLGILKDELRDNAC